MRRAAFGAAGVEGFVYGLIVVQSIGQSCICLVSRRGVRQASARAARSSSGPCGGSRRQRPLM